MATNGSAPSADSKEGNRSSESMASLNSSAESDSDVDAFMKSSRYFWKNCSASNSQADKEPPATPTQTKDQQTKPKETTQITVD